MMKKVLFFFTNYDSKKGTELEENNKASILFFWDKLERQVRIEGEIEKISSQESDKYYQTRPFASRIGAWASKQSQPLKSRFTLLREVAGFIAKYPINTPLPPYWGGYRLKPNYFEFWQGRASRLHDRIVYELINKQWKEKGCTHKTNIVITYYSINYLLTQSLPTILSDAPIVFIFSIISLSKKAPEPINFKPDSV